MASPATTTAYSNFSITDVNILFEEEMLTQPPNMVKTLYTQQPWTNGDPKRMTFDTFALPTFGARTDENDAAPEFEITEGDTLQKEFFKFAGIWSHTLELKTFDKENLVNKFVSNLSYALRNNVDHELTMQILSYANATTITPLDYTSTHALTTPDGVAVGASNHTVNSSSGTSRSNILASAGPINGDNIATLVRTAQANTVDDASRTIAGLDFDTIVISNSFDVRKKVTEIYGSELIPETANNAINFYRIGQGGHMKVIELNMGALNSQGNYDSSTARRYYWSLMDSKYFGANKWATAGRGVVDVPNPQKPNALFSLMAYEFLTYAVTRWQGKAYSFATTI